MKPEDFFKTEGTEEVEMTEQFGEIIIESESLNLNDNGILRIEENKAHSWTGVAGCNHSDTIKKECWGAVTNWAKNKMFEYRQYRCIKYGNGASRVRSYQNSDIWNGRSCSASTIIPCYIEFIKG